MLAVGIANTLVDVPGHTLRQQLAPPTHLARTFAVLEGVAVAATGIGALTAPLVAQLAGVRGALKFYGLLLAATIVMARGLAGPPAAGTSSP